MWETAAKEEEVEEEGGAAASSTAFGREGHGAECGRLRSHTEVGGVEDGGVGGERWEEGVDWVASGEVGWEWTEARERGELGMDGMSSEGGVDGALARRLDDGGVVGGGVGVDGGVESVIVGEHGG